MFHRFLYFCWFAGRRHPETEGPKVDKKKQKPQINYDRKRFDQANDALIKNNQISDENDQKKRKWTFCVRGVTKITNQNFSVGEAFERTRHASRWYFATPPEWEQYGRRGFRERRTWIANSSVGAAPTVEISRIRREVSPKTHAKKNLEPFA